MSVLVCGHVAGVVNRRSSTQTVARQYNSTKPAYFSRFTFFSKNCSKIMTKNIAKHAVKGVSKF